MSQNTSLEILEGITSIGVQGYKSLAEETSIEISPLTILAGANSSGKSSIMQPLLLLKQTLEASYDPGPLLLNGPNIRFTAAEQFLSNSTRDQPDSALSINIELENKHSITNLFKKKPNHNIELVETTYHQNGSKIVVHKDMSRNDILTIIPDTFKDIFDREHLTWHVNRTRCFLSVQINIDIVNAESPSPDQFETYIRNTIHVPGLRGNPERTYQTTIVGDHFPGTFEPYLASVVNEWQSKNDDRYQNLEAHLKTMGLAHQIHVRPIDDIQVELQVSLAARFQDQPKKFSLADVGFGVSQVMPVLVALLTAQPGQLVYLEQPEIHLHPRAQAALAQVLAEAAQRGVRVVAETHSALLLLALQSLVAEEKISPDLVKLHWFTRRQDGVTEVASADLDEMGAFGDWPEDFGDVELEWQSRYLDAAEFRFNGR